MGDVHDVGVKMTTDERYSEEESQNKQINRPRGLSVGWLWPSNA